MYEYERLNMVIVSDSAPLRFSVSDYGDDSLIYGASNQSETTM